MKTHIPMIKRIALLALAASVMMLAGCNKEKKSDPVSTLGATEITENSAVLTGHVNPNDLKDSKELGFFVSKNSDPDAENGTKFVANTVDGKNNFSVEAKGLKGGTQYYYVAYLTVGGANRLGAVKSFTTKEVEFDGTTIMDGRWDAYDPENETRMEQSLIFSNGKDLDIYSHRGGVHIIGKYVFENNTLTVNNAQTWFVDSHDPYPEVYEFMDPETFEPVEGREWILADDKNGMLTVFYEHFGYGWWLERQFILDSPTTAHGGGGSAPGDPLVYKYRE